jgi:hypothetical protein
MDRRPIHLHGSQLERSERSSPLGKQLKLALVLRRLSRCAVCDPVDCLQMNNKN